MSRVKAVTAAKRYMSRLRKGNTMRSVTARPIVVTSASIRFICTHRSMFAPVSCFSNSDSAPSMPAFNLWFSSAHVGGLGTPFCRIPPKIGTKPRQSIFDAYEPGLQKSYSLGSGGQDLGGVQVGAGPSP